MSIDIFNEDRPHKRSVIDKKKLKPEHDNRRSHLTDAQRVAIKEQKRNYSYNELAKMYKVSKTTIYFICNPDKYDKNNKRDRVYLTDKKKQREAVKKTRLHKQKLYEMRKL